MRILRPILPLLLAASCMAGCELERGTGKDGDGLGSGEFDPNADPSGNDPDVSSDTDALTDGDTDPRTDTDVLLLENHAPVAGDSVATGDEDGQIAATLIATDDNGDPLEWTITRLPAHGTVTVAGDSVVYRPDPDFNGTDSLGFRADDAVELSNEGTVTFTVNPVNDLPVPEPSWSGGFEDEPLMIVLRGEDVDGDALTYGIDAPPAHGTLVGEAPVVQYVPDPDHHGEDAFRWWVSDGTETIFADAIVLLDPLNDVPTAADAILYTLEDEPLPIELLAADVDGDPLVFVVETPPSVGILEGTPPTLLWTPPENWFGEATLVMRAEDGASASLPATLTLVVEPVNDPPAVPTLSTTTAEDQSIQLQLTADDPEGDPVSWQLVTPPVHGTVEIDGDVLTYIPDPDATGTDTFVVRATDGTTPSEPVTWTIEVTAVDDPPVATPGSVQTLEDTPVDVVLSGYDAEGALLAFELLTFPEQGSLLGVPPELTWLPPADWHGTTELSFRVSDGAAWSDPASVTLTATPANDPPTLSAPPVETDEDVPVAVIVTAVDADADVLTWSLVRPPALGVLSGQAPELLYTPDPDAHGDDSFELSVSDGVHDVSITVEVSITAVNDAPVAIAGSLATSEDTPLAVELTGTDVDGDTTTSEIVSGPSMGTWADGTYTPHPDQNGADVITFVVHDGLTTSAPARIDVWVEPVNDPPVIGVAPVVTDEDHPAVVSITADDVDGDTISWTLMSPPVHGSLTGTPPALTYVPAPDRHGDDPFSLIASDGTDSQLVQVPVTITPVNDAPTARAASFETLEDAAIGVELTGDDVDGDPLTYEVVDGPADGSLTGVAPNLTYVPDPNHHGVDSFSFVVHDSTSSSAPAQITVDVLPVNDPPVLSAPAVVTPEDTLVLIDITAEDADGDALTWTLLAAPTLGEIVGAPPSFAYQPLPDLYGDDVITLRASDGSSSATIDVYVTVEPVNDPPVPQASSLQTPEDTPLGIVLAATDVDGDPLTYTLVSAPVGTLAGTLPSVEWTPTPNMIGSAELLWEVSDGQATVGPVTTTLLVLPVDDPPVALSAAVTVTEDQGVAITLEAIDVDGDGLTWSMGGAPTSGIISGTPPLVTYTPDPDATGFDAFSFTVSDGISTSNEATVQLDITPVNDPPIAFAAAHETTEDTNLPLILGATDIDDDDADLTAEITVDPQHGTITQFLLWDGQGDPPQAGPGGLIGRGVTYVPDPDFHGSDSFSFRVADGEANSAPVTVGITVWPVNDLPVLQSGTYSTPEDSTLVFSVAASDVEGDALGWEVVGQPAMGSAIATDGGITYTPDPDVNGTDTLVVRAFDGSGWSLPSLQTIEVTPVNDAPVVVGEILGTTTDDAAAAVILQATDVDGDVLTYAITTAPAVGTATVTGSVLTYTPETDGLGQAHIGWTASDGAATSTEGTITITVELGPRPPVAFDDRFPSFGNLVLSVDADHGLLANDTDPNDDPLTVTTSTTTSSQGASVVIATDGSFVYSPPVGLFGSDDSFAYTISDGTASSTATVTIGLPRRAWYVNNTAPALGGTGRSDAPFRALSMATAAADAGDVFVVEAGNGGTTGLNVAITLQAGQELHGTASAVEVDGVLLADAAGRPTFTAPNGTAVTMGHDTVVRGISINGTGSAGVYAENAVGVQAIDLIVRSSPISVALINVQSALVDTLDASATDRMALYADGCEDLAVRNSVLVSSAWNPVAQVDSPIGSTVFSNVQIEGAWSDGLLVRHGALTTDVTIDVSEVDVLLATPDTAYGGRGIAVELIGASSLTNNGSGAVADGTASVTISDSAVEGSIGNGIEVNLAGTLGHTYPVLVDVERTSVANALWGSGIKVYAKGSSIVMSTLIGNEIAGAFDSNGNPTMNMGLELYTTDSASMTVTAQDNQAASLISECVRIFSKAASTLVAQARTNTCTDTGGGGAYAYAQSFGHSSWVGNTFDGGLVVQHSSSLSAQTYIGSNEIGGDYALYQVANSPLVLGAWTNIGASFTNTDGGVLAANGNTTLGSTPVVEVWGTVVLADAASMAGTQ